MNQAAWDVVVEMLAGSWPACAPVLIASVVHLALAARASERGTLVLARRITLAAAVFGTILALGKAAYAPIGVGTPVPQTSLQVFFVIYSLGPALVASLTLLVEAAFLLVRRKAPIYDRD